MKTVYLIIVMVILLAAGGGMVGYACSALLPAAGNAGNAAVVNVVHDTVTIVEAVAERRSEIPVAQVYFMTGSSRLNKTENEKLERIIKAARIHDKLSLILDGYADPTGGAGIDNDNLASQRTFSIYKYLMKNGVDKERVFMRSFGAGSDAAADSLRRVDVTLLEVTR